MSRGPTPTGDAPDPTADRPAALAGADGTLARATGTIAPLPPTPSIPRPTGTPSSGFLARATLLSAALSMAGALLGLGRDQALAQLFGAGAETDAFLVAWTVPEMASTLLIEDGMAFVLVPAFSLALARRAHGTGSPDPVRALVAASLPRLFLALAGAAAVLAAGAPLLVSVLAPGLTDPSLAVSCTRLTATCVLSFGLAGYCSAALRAHRSYLAPGAIYIAYNAAIIAAMFALGAHWGVRSAALGVAVGGCLMAAVQAPSLWRRVAGRPRRPAVTHGYAEDGGRAFAVGLVVAVLLFALCRQSQVLIERYFASGLPAGAISHLNYAQKIAQLPMSLSMMVCVVTFPVVARAIAEGDTRRAGERVERDLLLMACLVLLGAAVVVACAPQLVQLLFQRGAFTAEDTAATAAVMRVYALGLLGHTLVGALVRSYFSAGRTTWFPLGAMGAGALATVVAGAWAVDPWGARGIAAANAAGITLTALLLLLGLGGLREKPLGPSDGAARVRADRGTSRCRGGRGCCAGHPDHPLGPRTVPVRVGRVAAALLRPVLAAVCAAGAGLFCAGPPDSPAASLAARCTCVTAVFLLLAWLLDAAGARSLLLSVTHSVRSSVTRKLRHGR
ncbi:murein biosynthesis protein MurJ [Streptomyces ferrugineus]|uniref:Murein biosynthesis protein MurJ n=1 Tax=Streptomyces ferrugineus TaxID=1413221 RepID=A0A7M2SPI9_9ACTN|nr:lipid II flippase MurJ [Streptomyces ferrugineus]QOV38236.1 murein biosynthesis protein MurJ [Streptomyces ferrugineus]